MFESFRGEILREYQNWVSSGFRTPEVAIAVRDYAKHLSAEAAAGRYQALWPHQREAVLRAVFSNEILKGRDIGWRDILLNVVTGGGKTAIIAALMAYLRLSHDVRSFLLLSPNTIVRERLRVEFNRPSRSDSVWRKFSLFPPQFAHFVHDMTLHVLKPGSGSAGIRSAGIVLGNIHQLYDTNAQGEENLSVVLNHVGRIAVFNDEAHNTVAPKYDEVLGRLSESAKTVFRVDTTATPDRADGENPRSRMIYTYGVRGALRDGVIKRVFVCQPTIESVELTYTDTDTGNVLRVEDVPWEDIDARKIPATKWVTSPKPLRQQLEMAVRRLEEQQVRAQGRYKPILFVVAVSIADAYNAQKVLEKEFHLKTFVIASRDADAVDIPPEQRDVELKTAMVLGTPSDSNEYDAVVSVLMLREGWDVRSVSVIALLRKFSSPVYGQQVIGRGLRRMYPRDAVETERLVVVDHPKLGHDWLWEMFDAYVKRGVGEFQGVDLDEALERSSAPEAEEAPVACEGVADDSSDDILLPDPTDFEDPPLETSWRDYLRNVDYPRERVAITNVEKTGEVERDLSGAEPAREISYQAGQGEIDVLSQADGGRSLDARRLEVSDQIFDLTVEVLFNNGLPMSARRVVYSAMLSHVREKFLAGKTIGQANERQLTGIQDALHYVRPVFDRREVLRAILRDPPVEVPD